MSTLLSPSLAATTFLVALAAMVGCNAMTGADDLEVGDDSQTETRDSTLPRDRSSGDAGSAAEATSAAKRVVPKHPIECDGNTCDGKTPFCCQRSSGRAVCVDAQETCEGGLLTCSRPDDCSNGDVCCAVPLTNMAMCLPAVSCPAVVGQLLCEHDDECPRSKKCSGTSKAFDHSVCE